MSIDQNLHSVFGASKVAAWAFAQDPRPCEVYNLGGRRENNISMMECLDKLEQLTGKRVPTR